MIRVIDKKLFNIRKLNVIYMIATENLVHTSQRT
jgi:hypothetical protein